MPPPAPTVAQGELAAMVAPAGCYSVMAATVAPVARVVSVVTAPRGGPGEAAATLASRGLTAQTPRQNPMWSAARVVMAARAAAALASAATA
ncbi:PE-PGRS family protein [Mycobacterium tuberculosis]|nr:PE-PGRS family protein [Mycobacterium tuberculosis]